MRLKQWKASETPSAEVDENVDEEKSSRPPTVEVQILPWRLKEATGTSAFPLQQSLRDIHSNRPVIILVIRKTKKIVGHKDHAQKRVREGNENQSNSSPRLNFAVQPCQAHGRELIEYTSVFQRQDKPCGNSQEKHLCLIMSNKGIIVL